MRSGSRRRCWRWRIRSLHRFHRRRRSRGPPAEAAAGPESADVEFVRRAAEGGMKEVELGKLATDKASSEEVRAFGKQMVADHSKSNAELMALASMPPPSAPPKPEENLSGLSGVAFDRAYMAKIVTDHETTVELFEAEARDGKRRRAQEVGRSEAADGSRPSREGARAPEQGGEDNSVRMNPACAGTSRRRMTRRLHCTDALRLSHDSRFAL